MTARIIDGRAIAAEIRTELLERATRLRDRGVVPRLAVVTADEDASSASYVRSLAKSCEQAGVACDILRPEPGTAPDAIGALATNDAVHGIVLAAPLPPWLDAWRDLVPPDKDVDGAASSSAGRLYLGAESHPPATAVAVMEAIDRAGTTLRGSRAVVIGRSPVAGKPVAMLLLRADATVTICHSKTTSLPDVAREADVLVVAIGRPNFVDAGFVKAGATVIDVGINPTDDGVVGDVDTAQVMDVAGAVTPVPGGIGPMTSVMLVRNVVAGAEKTRSA